MKTPKELVHGAIDRLPASVKHGWGRQDARVWRLGPLRMALLKGDARILGRRRSDRRRALSYLLELLPEGELVVLGDAELGNQLTAAAFAHMAKGTISPYSAACYLFRHPRQQREVVARSSLCTYAAGLDAVCAAHRVPHALQRLVGAFLGLPVRDEPPSEVGRRERAPLATPTDLYGAADYVVPVATLVHGRDPKGHAVLCTRLPGFRGGAMRLAPAIYVADFTQVPALTKTLRQHTPRPRVLVAGHREVADALGSACEGFFDLCLAEPDLHEVAALLPRHAYLFLFDVRAHPSFLLDARRVTYLGPRIAGVELDAPAPAAMRGFSDALRRMRSPGVASGVHSLLPAVAARLKEKVGGVALAELEKQLARHVARVAPPAARRAHVLPALAAKASRPRRLRTLARVARRSEGTHHVLVLPEEDRSSLAYMHVEQPNDSDDEEDRRLASSCVRRSLRPVYWDGISPLAPYAKAFGVSMPGAALIIPVKGLRRAAPVVRSEARLPRIDVVMLGCASADALVDARLLLAGGGELTIITTRGRSQHRCHAERLAAQINAPAPRRATPAELAAYIDAN